MKRILSFTLSTLLLLGSLVGCTSQSSSDSELTQIDVVLDWYPNALHTFLYVAMEKGYFAEEGLEVNIQFPSGTADALSLVAAGQAEIGLYYQHDTIIAQTEQDVPVKAIASVVQAPLNIVLSLAEKEIYSPSDLVGKQIGYAGTALSEALIYHMLEEEGLPSDAITFTDVGFDLMTSMTTGAVDATIGCVFNHEVPQMEEYGFEVNWFSPTDYGVPNYYENIFVAHEDYITEHGDVLEGFLNACTKGYEDMKADPEGALEILLSNQNTDNFPLSATVETESLDYLLPLMETADTPFLGQSEAVWQENIDWLYDQGLIGAAPSVEDLVAKLG